MDMINGFWVHKNEDNGYQWKEGSAHSPEDVDSKFSEGLSLFSTCMEIGASINHGKELPDNQLIWDFVDSQVRRDWTLADEAEIDCFQGGSTC